MHKLSKSRRGGWLMVGPYDAGLVAAIKTLSPRVRTWEPSLKAWRIADEAKDDAQAIIDAHYEATP